MRARLWQGHEANSRQIAIDRRERIIDMGAETLKNQDGDHGNQRENQRVLDETLARLFLERPDNSA